MKQKMLILLLVTAALCLMFAMTSCHKKNPQPSAMKTSLTSSAALDASLSGKYKMVQCNPQNQLDTSLILTLVYRNSFAYSSADTTDKVMRYTIPNNINSVPGSVRISAGVIYRNEGVNHSQPYLEEHRDTIRTGFGECSTVVLNGGNVFSGDTLILNYHITPAAGGTQYDMHAKYLKR